jgi:predicted HTH domain antitoxin
MGHSARVLAIAPAVYRRRRVSILILSAGVLHQFRLAKLTNSPRYSSRGMATVNLELPADLVLAAKLDQGDVSQEAAKLIALELFREGAVSLGRAAELCETPLAAFMDFAAAHSVPPLNYGVDQLEEDRSTLAKLRS